MAPLAALPHNQACPKPCRVNLGDKGRVTEAFGILAPCGCFNCVACSERRKHDWGHHLASVFPARGTFHIWRGPRSEIGRITRRVKKKGGEYTSIVPDGGPAVVIATASAPGTTPIDLRTAIREMVAAVLAVQWRPGVKHKKFRPINASVPWKLPQKEKGRSNCEGLGRFRDPDRAYAVLTAMGVEVFNIKKDRANYRVPAHWSFADRKRAWLWAALGVVPPDRPGVNVPDLAAEAQKLIDMDAPDYWGTPDE